MYTPPHHSEGAPHVTCQVDLVFECLHVGRHDRRSLGREHARADASQVRNPCSVLLGRDQATQADRPQVFVKDAGVAEGTGPQGIKHAAGIRPALIETDAKSTPLFNAQGAPLGFTLAEWLAPTGRATLSPTGAGGVVIKVTFEHLRPDATYSLFENHFDQKPVGFTPLDGAGAANSFKTDAKGHATATVTAPQKLTHDNAILVILDDDGQTHGTSRGDIGINAQHQLIARLPG